MAAPVTCPAGTWTQIAPAGFGHAMIRFGNGVLRIEYAAAAPPDADTTSGIAIDGPEVIRHPFGLYPLRTGLAANAVFARPVGVGSITVERLF